MRIALALLAFAVVSSASAQPVASPSAPITADAANTPPLPTPRGPSYKEPGTATLIGVLITGGGHFYTGETGKGLTIMGVGVGAPVAGILISASTCDYVSNDVCYGGNAVPALIGLGVGVGAWIYGIADAGASADRMNQRNGYTLAVTPTVVPSQEGARPGLALSARF